MGLPLHTCRSSPNPIPSPAPCELLEDEAAQALKGPARDVPESDTLGVREGKLRIAPRSETFRPICLVSTKSLLISFSTMIDKLPCYCFQTADKKSQIEVHLRFKRSYLGDILLDPFCPALDILPFTRSVRQIGITLYKMSLVDFRTRTQGVVSIY